VASIGVGIMRGQETIEGASEGLKMNWRDNRMGLNDTVASKIMLSETRD
jgi:hypothetical protein